MPLLTLTKREEKDGQAERFAVNSDQIVAVYSKTEETEGDDDGKNKTKETYSVVCLSGNGIAGDREIEVRQTLDDIAGMSRQK